MACRLIVSRPRPNQPATIQATARHRVRDVRRRAARRRDGRRHHARRPHDRRRDRRPSRVGLGRRHGRDERQLRGPRRLGPFGRAVAATAARSPPAPATAGFACGTSKGGSGGFDCPAATKPSPPSGSIPTISSSRSSVSTRRCESSTPRAGKPARSWPARAAMCAPSRSRPTASGWPSRGDAERFASGT